MAWTCQSISADQAVSLRAARWPSTRAAPPLVPFQFLFLVHAAPEAAVRGRLTPTVRAFPFPLHGPLLEPTALVQLQQRNVQLKPGALAPLRFTQEKLGAIKDSTPKQRNRSIPEHRQLERGWVLRPEVHSLAMLGLLDCWMG